MQGSHINEVTKETWSEWQIELDKNQHKHNEMKQEQMCRLGRQLSTDKKEMKGYDRSIMYTV